VHTRKQPRDAALVSGLPSRAQRVTDESQIRHHDGVSTKRLARDLWGRARDTAQVEA